MDERPLEELLIRETWKERRGCSLARGKLSETSLLETGEMGERLGIVTATEEAVRRRSVLTAGKEGAIKDTGLSLYVLCSATADPVTLL